MADDTDDTNDGESGVIQATPKARAPRKPSSRPPKAKAAKASPAKPARKRKSQAKPKANGKPAKAIDSRTARYVPIIVENTMLGKSAQEIADVAEISREAVYRIRQNPVYREAFKEALAEQEQVFKDRLRALRDVALKTHLRVMTRSTRDGDALAAAISIFDRIGIPRLTKVEQTGEMTVNNRNMIDMTPFEGRSEAETVHFIENGVFPDGTKPVAN